MQRRILIVNDDGLHAPGLAALARAAAPLGRLACVAPDRNCSGAAQSISLERPVGVRAVDADRPSWAVAGTPADAVYLALSGGIAGLEAALGGPPELVLSGINKGENLGDDLLYSGTVGAASVAALFGCPALALSAPAGETALEAGAAAVLALLDRGLFAQAPLWNINLPAGPQRGLALAHQGRRRPPAGALPALAPRGAAGLWLGDFGPGLAEPGSDFAAVAAGLIALTPLSTSRCDLAALQRARAWLGGPAQ